MCFAEDLYGLRVLLHALNTVSKRRSHRGVLPLVVISAREALLRLIRSCSHTVMDTTVKWESSDFSIRGKPRMPDIRSVVKNIRVHGIEAVSFYSYDLLHVLHYYDYVEPPATTCVPNETTVYDRSFTYRTLVMNGDACGPIVALESSISNEYDYFCISATDDCRVHLSQRLLSEFRRSLNYRYNQGMFFGPPTRTTRSVCFELAGGMVDAQDCECVVIKENRYSVVTAPIMYEPVTQELRFCTDEDIIPDANFEIVCEQAPLDESRTKVSLVVAARRYHTIHGVQVMRVEWIEAGQMHNEKLYTATVRCPESLERGFPYDRLSRYKTWHLVLGNGCRIEVRTETRRLESDEHLRWTLINTDEHPDFDECAHILQRYYEFQALEGSVHPLDLSAVYAFLDVRTDEAGLDWLATARIERPSSALADLSATNRQTVRFVHAMVMKHLTTRGIVKYKRLSM